MEYLPTYTDSLYLIHHGIKGQKWGVRRYQNEDGSLTEAGKAREKRWKGPDTFRYRRLNRKADRGDRLRAEGKTIGGQKQKAFWRSIGMYVAGNIATNKLLAGKNIRMRYGDKHLIDINPDTVAVGTVAAAALLNMKTMKDNSDIRASYRREQKGQYWAG